MSGAPSTLRILHTSDVHIGDSFSRDDAIGTLVDLALVHAVDVMVIVGDFFDNNRVETDAAQAIVDKLHRLPVPVVVLPGNHDPLLDGTIYERVVLPDHVRVLTAPDGETVTLAELDLDIWGKPHMSYDDNRPLEGLPPRGASTWQVALAHGQLVQSADDLRRAYLITPEEIAGSERDYVALGHWDVQRDVSAGPVAAWYSGSPSRKAVCALVTFTREGDERRVHVQSIGVD